MLFQGLAHQIGVGLELGKELAEVLNHLVGLPKRSVFDDVLDDLGVLL